MLDAAVTKFLQASLSNMSQIDSDFQNTETRHRLLMIFERKLLRQHILCKLTTLFFFFFKEKKGRKKEQSLTTGLCDVRGPDKVP